MEPKNHIEIYPHRVFIDGVEVIVKHDGLSISTHGGPDDFMTVTMEVLAKSLTVYPDDTRGTMHWETEAGT